jgi:hypothetical protein
LSRFRRNWKIWAEELPNWGWQRKPQWKRAVVSLVPTRRWRS